LFRAHQAKSGEDKLAGQHKIQEVERSIPNVGTQLRPEMRAGDVPAYNCRDSNRGRVDNMPNHRVLPSLQGSQRSAPDSIINMIGTAKVIPKQHSQVPRQNSVTGVNLRNSF
jgi:hypothetical protein